MFRYWIAVLVLALSLFAGATQPEVLWWRVDEEDSVDWYGSAMSVEALADMKNGELYAKVSVRDSSGNFVSYLDLYTFDDSTPPQVIPSGGQTTQKLGVPPVNSFADLTGYSGAQWSFAVELGNEIEGQWVSYVVSEVKGYASLGEHITNWQPGMTSVSQHEWVPRSFTVPEPGSALLLLVGGGLLALRRRRRG
jgi:hypothetical protein